MDVVEEWYKEAYFVLARGRIGDIVKTAIRVQDMIQYFEYFDTPYDVDVSCTILSQIDLRMQDYARKKREAEEKREASKLKNVRR